MGIYEESDNRGYSVARDRLPNGIVVSTIHLGDPCRRGEYETMVFLDGHGPCVYGDHGGDRRLLSSDEAARAMHEEFLAHWRAIPAEQTIPLLVDALCHCYGREHDQWRRAQDVCDTARDEAARLRAEIAALEAGGGTDG